MACFLEQLAFIYIICIDVVSMTTCRPGKFGLDQTLQLTAGTYEVSAKIATFNAEAGEFGNSYTFLAMVEGGRTIGDVPIIDTSQGEVSMDWRMFGGNFSLATDANVTVYFRAWGVSPLKVNDMLSDTVCINCLW